MWGLHQRNHRRPNAEFPLPEISRIGCGRQYKRRPNAPNDLALLRREEERWVHVSHAGDAYVLRAGRQVAGARGLATRRSALSADDQIPIFRDADRNHRLDQRDILDAVGRPNAEVPGRLDRDADEAGDGVLCLLSQFFIVCRRRWVVPVAAYGVPGAATGLFCAKGVRLTAWRTTISKPLRSCGRTLMNSRHWSLQKFPTVTKQRQAQKLQRCLEVAVCDT